jgi:hypothetical protein
VGTPLHDQPLTRWVQVEAWQRRTKAWQTMTNPAWGAKRPRSVKSDNQPQSANASHENDN